jgi:hypothetical protein
VESVSRPYIGKYRGMVTNNIDPLGIGRMQVNVPDTGAASTSWAMPCVPYAGDGIGFFAIPPVGSGVWVEYERGDLDYPIWDGCYWMSGQAPESLPGPQQIAAKVFKTDTITMKMNDLQGASGFSIEIELPAPAGTATFQANADGMTISWGSNSIELDVRGVSINGSLYEAPR